jgi:hypothetical protein
VVCHRKLFPTYSNLRTKRNPVFRPYPTARLEAHLSPPICHVSLLITHSSQVCTVVALDVYFCWSFKTGRRIQRCLAFQRRAERSWRARPLSLRAMLSSTSNLRCRVWDSAACRYAHRMSHRWILLGRNALEKALRLSRSGHV